VVLSRGWEAGPSAKDAQVFDDKLPGFDCRKFKGSGASYFVKYNPLGLVPSSGAAAPFDHAH
jgi:hypothetical protein